MLHLDIEMLKVGIYALGKQKHHYFTINIWPVDALEMLGARASAGMILTLFP